MDTERIDRASSEQPDGVFPRREGIRDDGAGLASGHERPIWLRAPISEPLPRIGKPSLPDRLAQRSGAWANDSDARAEHLPYR